MARTYLSFLDHSVAEFLDVYNSYEKLRGQPPESRALHKLAQAVIGLHLAIEKATKAGLSDIDPALLIKGLGGEILQRLQGERLLQSAPAILAIPSKTETHHLVGLLHISRPLLLRPLDDDHFDKFLGHIQDLVDLRNQIVHKEFFGETDYVITVMTQVLSDVRSIMAILSPRFLPAVAELNDQIISRLKAVELEIDSAWQVLVDYLSEGRSIEFTTDIWITIAPSADQAEVSLSGPSLLADVISGSGRVPKREESGFLLREIKLPPPPTPMAWSPLAGGKLADLWSDYLDFSLSPERQKGEDRTLVPPEDSAFQLRGIGGRLSTKLAERKKAALGVNVLIENFIVQFKQDQNEGIVQAVLRPTSPVGGIATAGSVEMEGPAFLESEFVTREGSEHFAPGTTMRKVRAKLRLKLGARGDTSSASPE
jgi:hypothetical protein